MSFIQTKQVEPVVATANRAEFRLAAGGYLTNWRLAEMGAVTNLQSPYCSSSGVYGLIENITLYIDNVEVDACRDVGFHSAFINTLSSNENSYAMNEQTAGVFWGFRVNKDDDELEHISAAAPNQGNTTNATTYHGTCDAGRMLGYCSSTPAMYARDNIRIVVEYKRNVPANIYTEGGVATYTPIRPLLFVDVLMGDYKMPAKVPYYSWENDRNNVAVSVAGAAQRTDAKVNGYNGKFVQRLMLAVQPLVVGGSNDMGLNQSLRQVNQVVNWRLNGAVVFPILGQNSSAKALAEMSDTFGENNCPLGGNNAPQLVALGDAGDVADLNGRVAYNAYQVNDKIYDLVCEYSRTGDAVVPAGEASVNLVTYAECVKQLEYRGNGQLVVTYA